MFDMNDHNRVGTQEEVEQCCNCVHNDHGANDIGHPCIVCYNIKGIKDLNINTRLMEKQGFVYVAYSIGEMDEYGDLIYSKDFLDQLEGFPYWCPLKEK